MSADMWRWWWYDYQWLLSFYLYTLLKKDEYILDKTKKYTWKKFWLFANRINKFKSKCIKEYWDDFNIRFEVLVEGEEKCLDDITFISDIDWKKYDNNIFLQVKTKWWDESYTITTSDWIYKAVRNFLSNLNFQNNKNNGNILFFIFVNKMLSEKTSRMFKTKWLELYLSFIDNICNNRPLKIYPQQCLDKLYTTLNKELIIDLLNGKDIFFDKYLNVYTKGYLEKLKILVLDLIIMFERLEIIEEIDYDLLESELLWFYSELDFMRWERKVRHLCWKWDEIKRWTKEFEKYEKYKYTYFLPNDWWKFIHQIDTISKWKFI